MYYVNFSDAFCIKKVTENVINANQENKNELARHGILLIDEANKYPVQMGDVRFEPTGLNGNPCLRRVSTGNILAIAI